MRIDNDIKLDFSDVLLLPKRSDLSSRSEVNIEREIKFKHSSYVWKGVPIIVSNMDTTGTIEMALKLQEYKIITCLHKFYTVDDIPDNLNPDYFMISTGITDLDFQRLDDIITKKKINFICVDVANGYSINFQNKVKEIKSRYPDKVIVAGNVVTRELVEELIMHCGVDNVMNQGIKNIVLLKQRISLGHNVDVIYTKCTPDHKFWVFNKETSNFEWCELQYINENMRLTRFDDVSHTYVYDDEIYFYFIQYGLEETWDIEVDCSSHSFIANGYVVHNSVCTTRLQTGVGYPQFSAVLECADAAHGLNGHIISDGGIQNVGDFSKAFGGGADFVMCGSMFAGHTESGGELVEQDGKKYKVFYGMSSSQAMNKYHGGVAQYRSAEGKCVKIPYKGDVADTILNILGGIRSCMTYVGAHNLKDIPKCSSFIRVNNIVNKIYSADVNHN